MGVLAVDRAGTREALLEVTEKLADMIRPLPDTAIPIPGADWTVGETANHVAMAGQLFVDLANGIPRVHGDVTKEGMAAANAEWLARDPERRADRLADAIVSSTRTFLDTVEGRPPTQSVMAPAGKMDMETLVSYALTHTLMHDCAIARALRKPLPVMRAHVNLMMPFLTVGMESFVLKEKTKDLRRVDCHIVADPVALFLVAMGLKKQWGPIATGKLMTWGTKPWLALQFVGFFATP